MDALIAAAASSLFAGDALGAFKRGAPLDDPPALALRGVAVARRARWRPRRPRSKRAPIAPTRCRRT
jgi:hypothetical protein